jgi:hypothetical protein
MGVACDATSAFHGDAGRHTLGASATVRVAEHLARAPVP